MLPLPLLSAWLAPAAHAALPPGRVEANALVGMRVGGGVLATVDPVRHVEVGGSLSLVTDFYAMAPDWVTDGLDPSVNLRFSPRVIAGLNTGPRRFQAALLGTAGMELLTFRESKTVPALDQPVEYGTTEVAFVGGVGLDLRYRPWDHLGFNLLAHFGLPAPPSALFDTERSFVGIGATWGW